MIDFDALVVSVGQTVFGEPVSVWPKGNSSAAYDARGSWSERPVDVALQDDLIASSQVKTLAIRRSEFRPEFGQGDHIVRLKTHARYIVDDVDDDGQGGSLVTLKSVRL